MPSERRLYRPAICAIALGMLLFAWTSGKAAEFRLRSECQSRGAVVTFGDVAEIFSSEPQQTQTLANMELFPAPSPGQKRYLRLREIQDLLLLRGVNLAGHRFSGYALVRVICADKPVEQRPSGALSPVAVRQAHRRVQEAVLRHLRQHVSADRPWVVKFQLDPDSAQLVCDSARAISATGGGTPWTGLQHFQVIVDWPDGPRQFALEAEISLPPAVVLTARSLPRGALIRAEDVELRSMAALDGRNQGFLSIDAVVGQETTRAIPEGRILARKSVRAPLLVRRGEVVTVSSRSPGVCVRTMARARDNGSLGDLIAVESLQDRSTYFARVCKLREVEVYARSMKATR